MSYGFGSSSITEVFMSDTTFPQKSRIGEALKNKSSNKFDLRPVGSTKYYTDRAFCPKLKKVTGSGFF
jgi:hypothetical protein